MHVIILRIRLDLEPKINQIGRNQTLGGEEPVSKKTLEIIKENAVEWVDLRFTDIRGKEQHLSIPASQVNKDFFEIGKMFDGSSIAGWKAINESDMALKPVDETAVMDPFTEASTLNLRCYVAEPATGEAYSRDPRSIAMRAEQYLKETGVGDAVYFGPEPEFFIFDGVQFQNDFSGSSYKIISEEAQWSSDKSYDDGNIGHRTRVKGGYFPVPPVDSFQDLRSAMCAAMTDMGLEVEVHHHEVGTAGQSEIGVMFNTLVKKADEVQILKYCVHNTAHIWGKTATFMPKPIVGDNGNGMHLHQSISKGGDNVFSGDLYAGLSQEALYYIGGVIKHARALNAFSNASTNSYKRLVPGFEAPVILAYSACNRSASIRIPHVDSPKARRIEVRFPDPTCNPYLAFSAILLAGLDGISNKIDPGEAAETDLYENASGDYPTVAHSLDQALEVLDQDRDFLLQGNVFDNDMIDNYIALKREEVDRTNQATHPVEFDMYYSC